MYVLISNWLFKHLAKSYRVHRASVLAINQWHAYVWTMFFLSLYAKIQQIKMLFTCQGFGDLCPVHFIFRFSFFVSFGDEVTKISCHFQARTVQLNVMKRTLFLFGLVWHYSTNQNQYNKGTLKLMALYLQH